METTLTHTRFRSFVVSVLLASIAAFAAPRSASAQTRRTWDGDTSTTFSAGGNWIGGTAPSNSISADIGVFGPTLPNGSTTFQPTLTASQSINGLVFESTTGGWTLGGAGNTLTIGAGGVTDLASSGTTTINANVSVGNSVPWNLTAGGNLAVNGSFTMQNANNNLVVNSGQLTISALTAAASGGVTKTGAGTLVINGATPNANLTSFRFTGGKVVIGHKDALGSGALTFDANTSLEANTDLTGANALANTLVLNGIFGGSRSIEFSNLISRAAGTGAGGTFTNNIAAGKQLIFNDVKAVTTAGATGNSAVTFAGAGETLVKGQVSNGSNATALTKSDAGTLRLSGSNTYTGLTTVSGGVLLLENANALPGGIGSTGGISALTISGGVIGLGNGNFTRAIGSGTNQMRISTSGGFAAYNANRTVNLGGASGTATWGDTNFMSASGTFILGASSATHMVDFQNPIALGNPARTVQVNRGSGDVDARLSGVLSSTSGTGGLIKTGNGVLELTNVNTYSGTTTINAGRFLVSGAGNLSNTARVVVDGSGADFRWNSSTAFTRPLTMTQGTISGTGTISASGGVSIGTNAILSPGNSPGIQAYTTGLTWADGGSYLWEINDWTGSAGTAFDQLAVSGSPLNITATSGNPFTILITSLTGANAGGNVPNFNDNVSKTFTIATSSVPITGFDASKFTLNTSSFTNPFTGSWSLSATGSTVLLNYTAGVTTTTGSYSLSALAAASAIRVNGTTGITATITNTGAGTADALNYSSLDVGNGVTISPATGSNLAQGASGTGTGFFTTSAPGAYTFDPTASVTNVAAGGAPVLSGSTATTVTVYNPASANTLPATISFGNIYASGSFNSQNLSIWNTGTAAATFQEGLNASVNGSTGGATASGSITNLSVAGGTSSAISVGLTNSGSAGVQSGNVTLDFASNGTLSGLSNLALGSQSVALTGTAWNPATVNSITSPVSLGNVRVGGSFGTSNLSIENTAASGPYTEVLGATGSTSGLASLTGSVVALAGGSTSTAISVGLGGSTNTGSAGVKNGTATISFTSTGGPGTASISSQNVSVSGTVWNAAAATTSGSVNLGTVIVGSTSAWSQTLSITNSAPTDGFSESLNASFGSLSGVTTNSGSFNLLAAGSTNNTALAVALATGSVGNLSGSAQINFQTDGQGTSGLAAESLSPQTVNVYGTVLDHATSSLSGLSVLLSSTISLGTWDYDAQSWTNGNGTNSFSIFNLNPNSLDPSFVALLNLTGTSATGDSGFTLGSGLNPGTFAMIAGGTSASYSVSYDPTGMNTQGTFTRTFTFNMADQNLPGGQATNTLTLTAAVIVVPEPGALALAGIGIAAAAYAYRRRRS